MTEPLTISNSEIQSFKRCRRRWYLAYYRKLLLKKEDVTGPRSIGTRVHGCVAHYYTAQITQSADAAVEQAIALHDWSIELDVEKRPDIEGEIRKEADLSRAMLEGYFEWLAESAEDEGMTVVGVEEEVEKTVAVPVQDGGTLKAVPVRIRAKLDLRVAFAGAGDEDETLFLDHKAQPLTACVLTPTGWRRMGSLQKEDEIVGADGSTQWVVDVHPQGVLPLYRVTTTDGASTVCSGDHLWHTKDRSNRHWTTITLNEMRRKGVKLAHQNRWELPLLDSWPGVESNLHIDPYVLGRWLSDGTARCGQVCIGKQDAVESVGLLESAGYRVTKLETPLMFAVHGLIDELRKVDLLQNKHVPIDYLRGSSEQRLALLQGLMDGDGTCNKNTGQTVFTNTSPILIHAVTYLVRSLGGMAFQGSWRSTIGKDSCQVTIRLPDRLCPFRLVRHCESWGRQAGRSLSRRICAIEEITPATAQCITTSAPNNLYVTDDFLVTHNTVQEFTTPTRSLHLDEQLLLYHWLLLWHPELPGGKVSGAMYNMIRKVKRSARAKPPFFERFTVRHTKQELRSFHTRLMGELKVMVELRMALDNGADPLAVCYPTPTRNCSWDCDFFAVCNLIDRPEDNPEHMLQWLYREGDPYERYTGEGSVL